MSSSSLPDQKCRENRREGDEVVPEEAMLR
jgi:hypothetical protein